MQSDKALQALCLDWNWHWACNVYNIWMKDMLAMVAPASLVNL